MSPEPTMEPLLYVDGEWRAAEGGATFEVLSPIDGEPASRPAAATMADVDRAVAAAVAAQRSYRWQDPFSRAALMESIAAAIDARAEELATAITAEMGKPIGEARGEAGSASGHFRVAAAEVRRLGGEVLPVADPGKRVWTVRQPHGVFAFVTAFNYPAGIPAEYIAPALAVGNGVVLKPSPQTPGVAAVLVSSLADAGVPDGLVNLITTADTAVASHLVSHPGVAGVGFTGSTAVGRQIAALAAGKELVLELGGNGPTVVLDDADVELAAAAIARSSFRNAGQICTAAGRVLAASSVEDELAAGISAAAGVLVLGDPREPETTIGPLAHAGVAGQVRTHLEDAVAQGARVVHGGAAVPGFATDLYFEPTVLAGLSAEATAIREETFGPVAPVAAFDDDEAILEAANSLPFGLSAAVFTRDLRRAHFFAERLEAGQVTVNDATTYGEQHIPFGGWGGEAGTGRLGGRYAQESFSQLKTIAMEVFGG
jgi:acyl-CoA reductase-like NAD-dependent aldehyde dehydrogenase